MARQVFIERLRKDPIERLDYTFPWGGFLAPIDDHIVDAEMLIEGDPQLQVWLSQFSEFDATVGISGGTLGAKPAVSCVITTSAGRVFKRSIQVAIIKR
ncbi:hypothetical protein [Mycolicibacterium sphagni]|uniref:Uncharacterized protein n=1 Tax=Mycolicibacterium sphagni TaxID=1786 RepID=A0A255DWY6_9MYCO|nr:hypothetical protein [Mycolicibacterium sphagni]OYN81785.1 hypothetical protein CG716_05435 [Mycolicibacterium sphagni]